MRVVGTQKIDAMRRARVERAMRERDARCVGDVLTDRARLERALALETIAEVSFAQVMRDRTVFAHPLCVCTREGIELWITFEERDAFERAEPGDHRGERVFG